MGDDQQFTIMPRSVAIHYVTYKTEDRELEVGFHGGRNYSYFGVPLQVAVDFITSLSLGQYYNRYIKEEFGLDALLKGAGA